MIDFTYVVMGLIGFFCCVAFALILVLHFFVELPQKSIVSRRRPSGVAEKYKKNLSLAQAELPEIGTMSAFYQTKKAEKSKHRIKHSPIKMGV